MNQKNDKSFQLVRNTLNIGYDGQPVTSSSTSKLQTANGDIFYIGCSDCTYYIGLSIDEHSW